MKHLTLTMDVLALGDLALIAQVELVLIGMFCREVWGVFQ